MRTIDNSLIQSASDLIAEGYFDSPAHEYICPDPTNRFKQLSSLLGSNLRLQISHGADSFCLAENCEVQAMGFWTRPNERKVGIMAMIQGGLLVAPFRVGFGVLFRAMSVSKRVEMQLTQALGNKPFLYLNNMIVKKEIRGQGIGSKLLQQQLEAMEAKYTNPTFALATQKLENIRFYERLGFRTALQERIGAEEAGFLNWIMVR